jgi:hypothetical protein
MSVACTVGTEVLILRVLLAELKDSDSCSSINKINKAGLSQAA